MVIAEGLACMGPHTFKPKERVRNRQDYLRIYDQGERVYTKNFIIITAPHQLGGRRMGTAVGKKVGNAVKRNRIKRLLREFFRLNKERFQESRDSVIIARKGIQEMTYRDVYIELEDRLFKKRDV